MIHWAWLIPAAMLGGVLGFYAAALCWISRESEDAHNRMTDDRREEQFRRADGYDDW